MPALIIRHIPDNNALCFQVARIDGGKSAPPVTLPSPYTFPIDGRPNSNLMTELAWYLESFLDYPFPPETDHADRILAALNAWGTQCFQALFSSPEALRLLDSVAPNGNYAQLHLHICSDNSQALSWPWEALRDPQVGPLAQTCQIDRRLNNIRDPQPISDQLPKDRLNILLITARPDGPDDVSYRSISRPLITLIDQNAAIPASVHILRPPTFVALRAHLQANPHNYHILHFDGHGVFAAPDTAATGGGHYKLSAPAPQGHLLFETDDGGPDPVSADKISPLLREFAIPAVVLNACQSGMITGEADSPFASVAAALLQSGVRSVLAMSYSLYVSAAQKLLRPFYKRLLATGDFAVAAREARVALALHPNRTCARGEYPLQDYLVPVLYQQSPLTLSLKTVAPTIQHSEFSTQNSPPLPEEATDPKKYPHGLIGRDTAILHLERALRRPPAAVLIHGLAGIGKTTLAAGFLRWLKSTGGLGLGAAWFDFRDIRSAESIFNRLLESLGAPQAVALPVDQKLPLLCNALKQNRLLLIFDNFESASGIPPAVSANLTESDRQLLLTFLCELRGGQTKVLITSRSDEPWLPPEHCYHLPLSGLRGEELWEYTTAILKDLGLVVDRNDPMFTKLLTLLGGHPLTMRAMLSQLASRTPADLITSLTTSLTSINLPDGHPYRTLYATLTLIQDRLPADLRPLLIPLALHEHYLDADYLEAMAKYLEANPPSTSAPAQPTPSRPTIDRFLAILIPSGLIHHLGQNIYDLHPALTGFLRAAVLPSVPGDLSAAWTGAFVGVMAYLADALAPRKLHEQRFPFHVHRANFYHALAQSQRLNMPQHFAALTQSLAAYALNTRDYAAAATLFLQLAESHVAAGDPKVKAGAYHQLGIIAQEQRDFAAAEAWYRKALAIKEKQGDEHGAAATYHQLGIIAQEQRDFAAAEVWYRKSLAIEEKQGDEHGAAATYHQLGTIAQEQRDFAAAEAWYRKSLAIKERQGNEHGAAITYHQLGRIAEEQRDFAAAEAWYRKSLAIKEKQGDEHGAASTYHQLGIIAQEQRDFAAAEVWYRKSLAIEEKQGHEHGAANTYHQLGMIAQKQRDFAAAEAWYRKSLAIEEKQGHEHGAAITYHQLGRIAEEQRDFAAAEAWYRKSLAIEEKQGDEHGAASTYHQLGMIAQEQRDFAAAESWYRKSLAIEEKQGHEHGAATSYGQLGILAGLQSHYLDAGKWLMKCILAFAHANDPHGVQRNAHNFVIVYSAAPSADRPKLRVLWDQAASKVSLPSLPSDEEHNLPPNP